jgi:hypothetical protein
LALRALRSHRRNDLNLCLAYKSAAAAGMQLTVERERACRAFLSSAPQQGPASITVTVIAPEVVRGSAMRYSRGASLPDLSL